MSADVRRARDTLIGSSCALVRSPCAAAVAELERAALGYVAARIRESGELVTVELGPVRMADFVESLELTLPDVPR